MTASLKRALTRWWVVIATNGDGFLFATMRGSRKNYPQAISHA